MSYSAKRALRKTIVLLFASLMAIIIMPRTAKANTTRPFFGVWCYASKDYNEAMRYASQLSGYGCTAGVYTTSEWSNLNPEKWYAVTAGTFTTEEAARNILPTVRGMYPDAYVKYTGIYLGSEWSNYTRAPGYYYEGSTAYLYQSDPYAAFFGIWCYASKRFSDAQVYADSLNALGFYAKVYLTSEWSNLNREPWYVVSAGAYTSESAAKADLLSVQRVCRDAYVKYSGYYQG